MHISSEDCMFLQIHDTYGHETDLRRWEKFIQFRFIYIYIYIYIDEDDDDKFNNVETDL